MTDLALAQVTLRDWQRRAVNAYHAANQKNFMAYVTPSSGKTFFGLTVSHDLLAAKKIKRLVVVVHTANLRIQWAAEAAKLGLKLNAEWTPHLHVFGDGVVLTYQQIAANPSAVADILVGFPTLVIFDEVHHVAEDKTWGTMVTYALEKAKRRLLLSGTPFRHDEARISYVKYRHGEAQIDFSYSYGDGLRDNVVAPVFFPTFEAHSKFKVGDKVFDVRLDDGLSKDLTAQSLQALVQVKGHYLKTVLAHAKQRLNDLREQEGHHRAKGLVVAVDQAHAREVARLVKRITGCEPALAISDDKESAAKIERFKTNGEKWLVAVRMVSEGVDIPDLRVGVWATNVQTELFFRQFVGRFTRIVADIQEQAAFIYIPRHEVLLEHARSMQEERRHFVKPVLEEKPAPVSRMILERSPVAFAVLGSQGVISDVIAPGAEFSQEDLARAAIVRQSAGMMHLSIEVVARILRASAVQLA